MQDEQKQSAGEEIRSPLQAFIRVVLVIVVVLVLIGFLIALFSRPERVVKPEAKGLQAIEIQAATGPAIDLVVSRAN